MTRKSAAYVVLVDGRYNNEHGRADDYSRDDPLITSPAYGASLVADGLVAAPRTVVLAEKEMPDEGGVVLSMSKMVPVEILGEWASLSNSTVLNLKTAGFKTVADVNTADDRDLLSIVGIGPATLRKIRGYLEDALESEYLAMLEEGDV